MDMARLKEFKERDDVATRVYDVLTFGAFTPLSDAWKRDPDPRKVSWRSVERSIVKEALGYGSIEACQKVSDEMNAQVMLLTVCGETCVVRNEVIDELNAALSQ